MIKRSIDRIKQAAAGVNEHLIGIFLLMGAALVATKYWGFYYGIVNNEFHSIIINRISANFSFQGDALASTMNGYSSFVWVVIGMLVKWFSITQILYWCYYASWLMILLGIVIFVLTLNLNKHITLTYLLTGSMVLISGFLIPLPLGADPVIWPYFSHTFFTAGICLIIISLSLKNKDSYSAIGAGAVYNLNAMHGNFLIAILMVLWIYKLAISWSGIEFKEFIKKVLLFITLALPTIIWIIRAPIFSSQPIPMTGIEVLDFAYFYFPDHYFIFFKDTFDLTNGIFSFFLIFLLLIAVKGLYDKFVLTNLQLIACSFLVFLLLGIILINFFPSRFVLQLHLLRSDVLYFLFLVGLLLAVTIRFYQRKHTSFFLFFLVLFNVLFLNFRAAILSLMVIILFDKIKTEYQVLIRKVLGYFLLCLALLFWFKQKPFMSILLLSFSFSAFVWKRQFPKKLLGILIFSFSAFLLVMSLSFKLTFSPDKSMSNLRIVYPSFERVLPKNALLVIPPEYSGRAYIKRALFITMRDGAAYLWSKGYEHEYLRRLSVLGINYTPGKKHLNRVVSEEFYSSLPISSRKMKCEGVTHIMLEKVNFPGRPKNILLEDRGFILLEIDSLLDYFSEKEKR